MHDYFVCIMASHTKTLYTGVTGDLLRRVFQHRGGAGRGFTARYNVSCLVYFETTTDVIPDAAIDSTTAPPWPSATASS